MTDVDATTATEHEDDHHAHGHHAEAGHDGEHGEHDTSPTTSTSSSLLILAVITAAEVAVSYIDLGPVFIPLLLFMMAIKFFIVVSFFMHLRFDNRIFTWLFYIGLVPGRRRVRRGVVDLPLLRA